MKIQIGNLVREMTAAEEADYYNQEPLPEPELTADEILNIILGGDIE